MYKLNQVLTTSTKLICKSIEKNITNLLKKWKNSPPHLTQLPWTVSSRQLGGGRGWGIYRHGPNAPVGAQQPVPNNRLRHRLKLPTGAFVVGTWRHRVMAKPGAIVRSLGTGGATNRCLYWGFGTGWCFNPVPNPLPLIAAGQMYQLLLQPVLMPRISTGWKSSWYFWPGPLARFLLVGYG